jgi:hypothetical protein
LLRRAGRSAALSDLLHLCLRWQPLRQCRGDQSARSFLTGQNDERRGHPTRRSGGLGRDVVGVLCPGILNATLEMRCGPVAARGLVQRVTHLAVDHFVFADTAFGFGIGGHRIQICPAAIGNYEHVSDVGCALCEIGHEMRQRPPPGQRL